MMFQKLIFKKIFALLFVAVFLFLPGTPAFAASKVVYTVVNDQFQTLSDATMPVEKGGEYYVPYTTFLSGFGGIKAYYSAQEQVLVLYDKEQVISFDIAHGYTYDQQLRTYEESAFSKNGTVFVPADFICSTWGFYYSVIPSSMGMVVRISKTSPSLSDSMLLYIGESVMTSLLTQYNKNNSSEPSDNEGEETPVSETRKTVYLTFDTSPGAATEKILDTLKKYRYTATFFCSPENMALQDDLIRQIVVNGNTIGLNANLYTPDQKENNPDTVVFQLNHANEQLEKIAKMKARTIRIIDAGLGGLKEDLRDSISLSGYRIWDYTIDATGKDTSYSISTAVNGALKKTSRPAVVMLGNRDADASALSSILSFLKQNNYIVLPIEDWDTPINSYQDIR